MRRANGLGFSGGASIDREGSSADSSSQNRRDLARRQAPSAASPCWAPALSCHQNALYTTFAIDCLSQTCCWFAFQELAPHLGVIALILTNIDRLTRFKHILITSDLWKRADLVAHDVV